MADMANGSSMNSPQYPNTVQLLLKLGSEFSNTCWASTCVNPTRPDKGARKILSFEPRSGVVPKPPAKKPGAFFIG